MDTTTVSKRSRNEQFEDDKEYDETPKKDKHSEDEHSEDEHSEDEHSEDEHSEDEHSEDEHSEDESPVQRNIIHWCEPPEDFFNHKTGDECEDLSILDKEGEKLLSSALVCCKCEECDGCRSCNIRDILIIKEFMTDADNGFPILRGKKFKIENTTKWYENFFRSYKCVSCKNSSLEIKIEDYHMIDGYIDDNLLSGDNKWIINALKKNNYYIDVSLYRNKFYTTTNETAIQFIDEEMKTMFDEHKNKDGFTDFLTAMNNIMKYKAYIHVMTPIWDSF